MTADLRAGGFVPHSLLFDTWTAQARPAGVASASAFVLSEGVLRAMFMTKRKIVVALLAACVALTGSRWLVPKALAANPQDRDAQGAREAKGPASVAGKA